MLLSRLTRGCYVARVLDLAIELRGFGAVTCALALTALGCNKSSASDASGSASSATTPGAVSSNLKAAPASASGKAPKTGTDENPLAPGGDCPGRVKVTADAEAKAAGVIERTIEPSAWGIGGCSQLHGSQRYRSSTDAPTFDTFYMQGSVELGETPTTQQPSAFYENPNVSLEIDFPGGQAMAPGKWDDRLVRLKVGDPGARITYLLPIPNGDKKKKYKVWACETKIEQHQNVQRAASGKFSLEVTSVQGKPPTPEERELPPIKQGIHGTAHAECPPAKLDKPNTAAGTVTLDITF